MKKEYKINQLTKLSSHPHISIQGNDARQKSINSSHSEIWMPLYGIEIFFSLKLELDFFYFKCQIIFISFIHFNLIQEISLWAAGVSLGCFCFLLSKHSIYDFLSLFTFLQFLKKFSWNTVLVVYSWSNIWAKNNATSSAARLNFTFLPAHKEKKTPLWQLRQFIL